MQADACDIGPILPHELHALKLILSRLRHQRHRDGQDDFLMFVLSGVILRIELAQGNGGANAG